MCGILGIYRPAGGFDAQDARSRLEAGAALLAHRGPDASGVTLWPGQGVGFAHRRLAILDLDPRANQPMASSDGTILLAFNGEIYNFRELREQLKERVAFRTESDSEVLIEGYRVWGMEGLLSRAAGMFAFGLYDATFKRLFLVRDRAGKKPLFYSQWGGGLQFASEIRGLLRLSPMAKEPDPEGLDAYLALKFAPSPGTLYKGVSKLAPGCYLQRDEFRAPKVTRYWDPFKDAPAPPADDAERRERIAGALEKAFDRRMVSDVPVCLFLSGGVDSSLMAAHLAPKHQGLTAYSIGYGDLPAYNEFEYSRMIAERFPVKYHEIRLESRQALEVLEDASLALDEPMSDWVWVPLFHLSRRARQDGFKVALLGEGADELFFGYDSMMKGLGQLRRFRNPLWRGAARAGAALLAPLYRRSSRGHSRYDLLRRAAAGEPVYMGSSIGWPQSQRGQVSGPRLLAEGSGQSGRRFIDSLYAGYRQGAPDPEDLVNLVCYVEFYSKMSEVLLQRVDRVSMLHSLEARSPFLDHELVELAFSIAGERKIAGGRLKSLLKEVARPRLPAAVVDRKKMGFSFPFKEWLRGPLGAEVDGVFKKTKLFSDGWVSGDFARRLLEEHRGGWQDHAPRVWMLFDLCRWYDRWMA